MKPTGKVVLGLIYVLVMVLCFTACEKSEEAKYKDAQSFLAKGEYSKAAAILDDLGSYDDSSKLSLYCKAAAAGENGDYETAFSTFSLLADYKDSQLMITYYQARKTEDTGNKDIENWHYWLAAAEEYESIPLFRDSIDRAEQCKNKAYELAIQLVSEEKYSSSIIIFTELDAYNDSAFMKRYYQAELLERSDQYREASNEFTQISEFKDSKTRAQNTLQKGYEKAAALEEAGDLEGAYRIFVGLGEYKDSIERACKPYYEQAEKFMLEEKYFEAATMFTKAYGYKDALKRAWSVRYRYLKKNQFVIADGFWGIVYAIKPDGTVVRTHNKRIEKEKDNRELKYRDLVAISYNCGLKADGTVIFIDKDGEIPNYQKERFTNIVQVSSNYQAFFGLKSDGTVVTASGRSHELTDTLSEWTDIVQIACGPSEAGTSGVYGLKADGTVLFAWHGKTNTVCKDTVAITVVEDSGYGGVLICLKKDGTLDYYCPSYDDLPYNIRNKEFTQWKNVKEIYGGTDALYAITEKGTLLGIDTWLGNCSLKKPNDKYGEIGYVEKGEHFYFGVTTKGYVFYSTENIPVEKNVPIDFDSIGTVGSSLELK